MNEHWFIFQTDQLLMLKTDDHYSLLDPQTLSLIQQKIVRQHAIGTYQNHACFSAEVENIDLGSNLELISLKQAYKLLGSDWFNIAAKAYQILLWDKNHQYCGRCSARTEKTDTYLSYERRCTQCGMLYYPRISPSIIVLIRKKEKILMARGIHFKPGVYGLIAGFIEPGENAEDAVRREVREEVGLEINNIHYFGSQAWPFPDSLMLAFTADYASGEIHIDPTEIAEANWFSRDEIPGYPSFSFSIAMDLIHHHTKKNQT